MTESWDLKTQLLEAIQEKGGFVSCHAHFDKAYFINKAGLDASMVDMETKWLMSDNIKKSSTQEQVVERIRRGLDKLAEQGCKTACTFVDAYDAVDHRAIDAANQVKEEYKDTVKLVIATQPLGGLVDKRARDLFEAICAKADIVGGLPSRDRPNDNKHFDALFEIAKNLNKPIHIHIDQENNPDERDTEKMIEYVEKYGYEGRTVAIHAISVSAQPREYRQKIYQRLASDKISVVVCPSAALGMKQLEKNAPLHNSIANVPEMLDAGVLVGLGVDNVHDFYHPFVDGDMWVELRMMQEACRYYKFDELVSVASENGKRILEIK